MKIIVQYEDNEVLTALNRLLAAGRNLNPLMKIIASHLEDTIEEAFKTETSPEGKKWQALSEVTKDHRAKQKKRTGEILQLSGELARSIVSRHDATSAIAGTNIKYATTHQFGAKKGEFGRFSIIKTRQVVPIPWGDIPARPFLGVSKQTRVQINNAVRRHIKTAFSPHG